MAKQVKEQIVENSSQTNKKTAKEIVKRHLKDRNDIITEADMQNIKIDTGLAGEQPLKIPSKKTRPKDEDKDNQKMTPWDVINE